MNTRRALGLYTMFATLLVFGAAPRAAAQDSAPTVTWTASTAGEGIPEEVAPGYTTFKVEGEGDTGYTLTVFRLKEGTTPEAFQEANAAIDRAFNGERDPVEAINAGLELAEVVGEAYADTGASGSFGTVLEAGAYVLDGSADSEEGLPERIYRTLTVAGELQAEAPAAPVNIKMVDFALPPDIAAGAQTWQVDNVGQQIHHMILFRLQDGKTMDDFMAWLETEGEGEPAADEAGGVGIMSPGRSNYVELDLTPGEYVAICFMPDHRGDATGQPHFMLGMMQTFTVAGE